MVRWIQEAAAMRLFVCLSFLSAAATRFEAASMEVEAAAMRVNAASRRVEVAVMTQKASALKVTRVIGDAKSGSVADHSVNDEGGGRHRWRKKRQR